MGLLSLTMDENGSSPNRIHSLFVEAICNKVCLKNTVPSFPWDRRSGVDRLVGVGNLILPSLSPKCCISLDKPHKHMGSELSRLMYCSQHGGDLGNTWHLHTGETGYMTCDQLVYHMTTQTQQQLYWVWLREEEEETDLECVGCSYSSTLSHSSMPILINKLSWE